MAFCEDVVSDRYEIVESGRRWYDMLNVLEYEEDVNISQISTRLYQFHYPVASASTDSIPLSFRIAAFGRLMIRRRTRSMKRRMRSGRGPRLYHESQGTKPDNHYYSAY